MTLQLSRHVLNEPDTATSAAKVSSARPRAEGKFIYVGDEKFWIKGVTYGTFRMDEKGNEQLDPAVVERDLAMMAKSGFNTVRTYTTPQRWFLDECLKYGLRVMVGVKWEQPTAFLEERGSAARIFRSVRQQVAGCAGHPAILCYIIGNEIPASIVRWYGRKKIERFIRRLYKIVRREDPEALVTYANYPSTEYLSLPFLDMFCFNVYLESKEPFEDYLARLHSLSGEKPVLITELGLDSRRNGMERQAETLDWQVRTVFGSGCCGCVVYSWTDEWYLGFGMVEDWDFGLTTRTREPKPALRSASRAMAEVPFQRGLYWPMVSVIVCSYNGAGRIGEVLGALGSLNYPDYEVIVVDDGSSDATSEVASGYQVKLIRTANNGLSSARNAGFQASTGEIIAYIDDDAFPDADWLRFLASSLIAGRYAAVGGPNICPAREKWIAKRIARAPGPRAVMKSDLAAEHVPGCNMAFWRKELEAIGGFDVSFRTAGDDVDVCWRICQKGQEIGYSPSAVVWHHPRGSIRAYWKQQTGYGKGEALLERKWPWRYSASGSARWNGRIYGRGFSNGLDALNSKVYYGIWGSAPFQSLYSPVYRWSRLLTPEWYFVISAAGVVWLLSLGTMLALPVLAAFVVAGSLSVVEAFASAIRGESDTVSSLPSKLRTVIVDAFILLIEPLARFNGRLKGGMVPWRRAGKRVRPRFRRLRMKKWRGEWNSQEATARQIQGLLYSNGNAVNPGREFDDWDLETRGTILAGARMRMAVEEHGQGVQLVHFRIWPRFSPALAYLAIPLTAIAAVGFADGAWLTAARALVVGLFVIVKAVADAGFAGGNMREALTEYGSE